MPADECRAQSLATPLGAVLGRAVPPSLKTFLLALAIIPSALSPSRPGQYVPRRGRGPQRFVGGVAAPIK